LSARHYSLTRQLAESPRSQATRFSNSEAYTWTDIESAVCSTVKTAPLQQIVDDEDEVEPIKAEALRDLEAIYKFQKDHPTLTRDAAQRARARRPNGDLPLT